MRKNIPGIIIGIELFLMIFIPLITFNWQQGKMSIKENRYLESFPTIFDSEGNISDTLSEDFLAWFKDNLGLRDIFVNISSKINYHILNKSPNEQVELGEEGWLFYTKENNLEIASGEYPSFDEAILKEICEQQVLIQQKLAQQGIEYILALPPSKVSIYPEYIKSGEYTTGKTIVDILADYLEENSDIKVIRIKDALIQEKEKSNELLYFKTDTHWSAYGRYVGYKKIINDMESWNIVSSKPVDVTFFESGPYIGDLATMIGNTEERYGENYLNFSMDFQNAVPVSDGVKYDKFQKLISESGATMGCLYKNDKAELKNVLIFGDSMIGACILPLLAENFSEFGFVWSYNLNQEIIDLLKPDVLIYDMSERNLSNLVYSQRNFARTSVIIDNEDKKMDVYYHDDKYEKVDFAIWSEGNGQDDLVFYEAEKNVEGEWHVAVDLLNHGWDEVYNVHIYCYDENGENVNTFGIQKNVKKN